MPRAAKRQRLAAVAVSITRTTQKQGSIQHFGRISKAQLLVSEKKLEPKVEEHSNAAIASVDHGSDASTKKKRKFVTFTEDVGLEADSTAAIISSSLESVACKQPDGRDSSCIHSKSSSSSKRSIPVQAPPQRQSPCSPNTPTKTTRGPLDSFVLLSSSSTSKNPAMSHQVQPSSDNTLPTDLQDLIDLFSSFLTALSLHYAHHGTMTPADLRLLTPTVARTWGKRAVSTEDIQRALGVLHHGSSEDYLLLSDYGLSKICVELPDHLHLGSGSNGTCIPARPIDEDKLNALFSTNLIHLHTTWSSLPPASPTTAFLPTLPLLPIHQCASLAQTAPLHAKGQRRLSEFKASAAAAAASLRTKDSRPLHSTQPARPPAADRRQSLLDRIKARSALQATLPPETTPAQLARQSALDRLPHLIRVLSHLSSSSLPLHASSSSSSSSLQKRKPRTTVLMPALLAHLRSNLSHPVSATEGYEAVEALVQIAPEWVEIVRMGGVRGVVVKRGGYLGARELEGRIEQARKKGR